MLWFRKRGDTPKLEVHQSFELHQMADLIEKRVAEKIVEKLSDAWVELFSEELLDNLSPDAVSEEVKKTVARKIASSMLKGEPNE